MGKRVFVIGASLSGIDALCELLAGLPASFPAPILIAQHVASHSPGLLPQILTRAGNLPASHPETGEPVEPGHIYVAPPDRHMMLLKGYVLLSHGPRENLVRPAVDPLFRSAAVAYGPAVVAAVLTGQLDDGTAGLLAVKDYGGLAIVQDPSEATAPSMPESAMRHVRVDRCCRLREMAALFVDLANDDPPDISSSGLGDLVRIENRMAEGIFGIQDWWAFEQTSTPSGLNCPDCQSALYEVRDPRFLRFRCRSGHAYSAASLLSGQADSRETHFSAIFGALIEEATVAKRVRNQLGAGADRRTVEALEYKTRTLEQEAQQVSEWLHEMRGLVEPGPD